MNVVVTIGTLYICLKKDGRMKLETAQDCDLDYIKSWLKDEELEYQNRLKENPYMDRESRGFMCNLPVIQRVFEAEELEVLKVDGKAIAFHFGQFVSPGITEVHPKCRGQGFGTLILEEILQRANRKKICILNVDCISERSQNFWSKFGFTPEAEFSAEYYKILNHSLPMPHPAEHTVTINFFREGKYYTKDQPYKSVKIPSLVEGNEILLSRICHNAFAGSSGHGEQITQVYLDDRLIYQWFLLSEEVKLFGFSEHPNCHTTRAEVFHLPSDGKCFVM